MKRGFTLIELMIVISILAIVAAVAIPAFVNYARRNNPAYKEIHEIEKRCNALNIDFPSKSRGALYSAEGRERKNLINEWRVKCKMTEPTFSKEEEIW